MAGEGLVSMIPSSISHTGTGATINADGSVSFTAITELNLNDVFTSDYVNYLMMFYVQSSATLELQYRWRASGVNDDTASSYSRHGFIVSGTSATGARSAASAGRFAPIYATLRAGVSIHIYGPHLAKPTTTRSVSVTDVTSAGIGDYVCIHNQSVSYDGINIIPDGGHNVTGTVHVFGYEE